MTPHKHGQFVYYAQSFIGPNDPQASSHSMWRRMSWCSKAVIEAVHCWEVEHSLHLSQLCKSKKMMIYYSTMFGEKESGIIVAEGILNPSGVVSPSSFQQSVHNAPVGYLMQMLQCDVPTVTITSGRTSFDTGLYVASGDLLANMVDIAVVIRADEYPPESSSSEIMATAEICVISNGHLDSATPNWQLESIEYSSSESQDLTENCSHQIRPLNLVHQDHSFARSVDAGQNRTIVSHWTRLPKNFDSACAKNYLPHREDMLLVDRLLEVQDNGSARINTTLRGSSLVFSDNIFQAQWFVEILAQASGVAFNAVRSKKNQLARPSMGYLLSIDDFEVFETRLCKPNVLIEIHVVLLADLFPIGKYEAKAFVGTSLVARSVMKFLSDEGDGHILRNEGTPT